MSRGPLRFVHSDAAIWRSTGMTPTRRLLPYALPPSPSWKLFGIHRHDIAEAHYLGRRHESPSIGWQFAIGPMIGVPTFVSEGSWCAKIGRSPDHAHPRGST